MDDQIDLPAEVPVMPLPGAVLFPHALLPLHIFEPRYREMLAHALQHDRVFAVALIKPRRAEWKTTADFFEVATVGLIRACIERAEGTSNLILQGQRRVQFSNFIQEHPFPIAQVEPLDSQKTDAATLRGLGTQLLAIYRDQKESGRQFPDKVDQYLSDLADPEMLGDLMAATFISDPLRRQEVLELGALPERLRLIIQYLREESGTAAA